MTQHESTPSHSDTSERQFTDAVRRAAATDLPDFAVLERAARRQGGRLRRRRQGGMAVASLAVVAVVGGGALLAGGQSEGPSGTGTELGFAGQGTPTPASDAPVPSPVPSPAYSLHVVTSAEPGAPATSPAADASAAYAVVDAPGWSAPDGFGDEKAYYVHGQDSVSLNWRPADTYGPKYTGGRVVATTTIDGDPADVFADGTVVGPVRGGRFLTLSGSPGMTTGDLVELATHVHRQ